MRCIKKACNFYQIAHKIPPINFRWISSRTSPGLHIEVYLWIYPISFPMLKLILRFPQKLIYHGILPNVLPGFPRKFLLKYRSKISSLRFFSLNVSQYSPRSSFRDFSYRLSGYAIFREHGCILSFFKNVSRCSTETSEGVSSKTSKQVSQKTPAGVLQKISSR